MHNTIHVERLFGNPNAINCSRSKFLVLSTTTCFLKPKIGYDQATFTQQSRFLLTIPSLIQNMIFILTSQHCY
jgi:hypothetical protein